VVRLRASGRNQLVPHGDGKRQVREAAPVKMSEFPPPYAELDSAVAMRSHRHAVPRPDLALNLCQDRIGHGPIMDRLRFVAFVAIFCGGLAALTAGMIWIAIALFRRDRRER
jgi:hypothetical protein